jgi:trimethylamine--corrinoid protein Co-methyltransferase
MRDLKYLSGAIEMGLLNAGASQMAHFYKLPIYTTAGMSDSKVNDAQAGYESALTNLMVALAGGNLIHDAAGFLEFCLTASYEKLVIDNEIIGMVMRALAGITVSKETLAFDVLKKAGPGGHFVAHRHTRRHMRRELYRPTLSDRQARDRWVKGGAADASARATKKAVRILNAPQEYFISEGIRKKILEKIRGLDPQILMPATPRRTS